MPVCIEDNLTHSRHRQMSNRHESFMILTAESCRSSLSNTSQPIATADPWPSASTG